MEVRDFDFNLPEDLIAQQPVEPRDAARLLVVPQNGGELQHRYFHQLPDLLQPGDVLVLNDTRVIPARLFGRRESTGAMVEILLLTRLDLHRWEVLVRPGRKAQVGDTIVFGNGQLTAAIEAHTTAGGRVIRFSFGESFEKVLAELGQMPLPPYIKGELVDPERYQTVYAAHPGSAAAPTAGLHFTSELMERLAAKGVLLVYLTLHVGLGTFRPVQVEKVEQHQMHAEFYQIGETAASAINQAKRSGGRVIAVGTTCVRTLETVGDAKGMVHPGNGWTDIFIYPGYSFKVVDGMITNFHLPRSTLIMLVSAMAGRERILYAYEQAIEKRYRFYSFGDAMLII